MELAKELAGAGFDMGTKTLEVHCKAFKDNSRALEMVWTPKTHPRKKTSQHKIASFL
jgi:hypothetical protein